MPPKSKKQENPDVAEDNSEDTKKKTEWARSKKIDKTKRIAPGGEIDKKHIINGKRRRTGAHEKEVKKYKEHTKSTKSHRIKVGGEIDKKNIIKGRRMRFPVKSYTEN